MIALPGRRWAAVLVAPLLLVPLAAMSAPAAGPPPTPPLSMPYSPPSREPSPFSASDQFCDPAANQFPSVKRTDPSLKRQPISVVLLAPAPDSPAADLGDDATVFAGLINECGGIGGRPFDLHVVGETGNPVVDCSNVTAGDQALLVLAPTASFAEPCIVGNKHTLMVTESAVSNSQLATSHGRLVATGSTEGVMWSRMLSLVTSGRLDDRAVALVAGQSATDRSFASALRALLKQYKIRLVDVQRANTILVPSLDPAAVPLLAGVTASARRNQPLDIYAFSDATPGTIDMLSALQAGDLSKLLRSVNVYAFSTVADPSFRMLRPPNSFSEMCNTELAKAVADATSSSTTTPPTDAPLDPAYLRVTDACLLVRIAARALFAAGVGLDQTSLMVALHRLPYIDLAAPGGTPKPRPNQVVNEPVKRIAQVVVLSSVQAPCPVAQTPGTTTSKPLPNSACWQPVSGWDDGGRVVNVPLTKSSAAVSR